MNLEQITVALRPRKPLEAIDLGFALARHWAIPLLKLWLLVCLPLFWLVWLPLRSHPFLALFLVWLIRPLFDHSMLYFLSRAMFGAAPATREAAAMTLRLWRRFGLASLSVYRLDPTRPFRLPIRQLEGLSGSARRERARVLGASGSETAILLTLTCWLIEFCLLVSLIGMTLMFLPRELSFDLWTPIELWFEGDGSLGMHAIIGALLFAAVTMVEPFYVAAGFALYLNRRTLLEGWDIELSFRNLARRLEHDFPREVANHGSDQRRTTPEKQSRPGLLTTMLVLLPILTALAAPQIQAQDSEDSATPAGQRSPQEVIQEILESEEFGGEEVVRRWRAKQQGPRESEKDGFDLSNIPGLGFLAELGAGVGALIEVLLWLAILTLVGMFIYALLKMQGRYQPSARPARPPPPEVVFGLDVRRESLPSDIAAEALALLRDGKITQALSLLYRGTLVAIIHRDQVNIEASWTEGECLRELEGKLPGDRHSYFGKLTDVWCQSAYAHRQPPVAELEALCRRWSGLFGEAGEIP
jgi:hypothetical protein